MHTMGLRVIAVNGYQSSNDDNQWFTRMFFLTSEPVESYRHLGCAYESSFQEAKRHGILPSDLRKGECDIDIYSKKDGVWL